MIDIEIIRRDPEAVKRAVAARQLTDVDVDALVRADEAWRAQTAELERVRHEHNIASTQVAALPDRERLGRIAELQEDTPEIQQEEKKLRDLAARRLVLWKRVPNMPAPDVPVGKDEAENRVLRIVGKPPAFDFVPKEHWEIGKGLGMLDIERAAKVSGSRFAYLMGDLVLLEFALIQHALSLLTNRAMLQRIIARARLDVPATPFIPVIPPALIRPALLDQMARLEPKEERYYLPKEDLYLIGSAEHTLGAMHADEILEERSLPFRYAGFSPAFRREAGSHGKDVHGILRVHQFDKLELECFTVPEQSVAEQDFLVAIQEHLLQSLGLPYRVVLMCTGDMGAPDARQIDLETWFPGQNRYRETHTADLITDYQARRLGTRLRRASGTKEFVHMNDATAIAIQRTIAALLEVHQTAEGNVRVPAALQSALGKDILQKAVAKP